MLQPLSAKDRYLHANHIGELIALLRAFLAGQKNRADLARWANDAWPSQQGTQLRRHAAAHVIVESLRGIDDLYGDGFVVRNQDIATYLEWLTRGNSFRLAREDLLLISTPIETLTSITGGQDNRWWLDGIGWVISLRFASLATGRCFSVRSPLSHERARWSSIQAHRDDDPTEAAFDVIETLAISGSEVGYWHPQLDVAKMPRWTVWRQDDNGGRFEVATYLSYSRAMRECGELESRGHKQMYWVERQGVETAGKG